MTTQVTTGVIADGSVTSAKLATGAAAANLGNYVSPVDGRTGAVTTFVADTVKNSTSGTNIDFTGIPSWAKRITVMFNGVSTSGTANPQIQLGTSGGFASSGYASYSARLGASAIAGGANFTSGFGISSNQAANLLSGSVVFTNLTGNTWTAQGFVVDNSANGYPVGGAVTLGAQLTQLRITTVGGTDTFDAGSINIMYE